LRDISDLKFSQYKALIDVRNEKDGENKTASEIIDELSKEYGKEHYSFCFKDMISRKIMAGKIRKAFHEIDKLKVGDQIKQEKKQFIKEIIDNRVTFKGLQYCKALHAEENAIIQASKIGGMGLAGGRIYTTTFPCELCAKKIQQVGIKEVIYVDPYPENISERVYLQDGIIKVKTRQFEGVKAYGYFKLFKSPYDEKDWQLFEKIGINE
jgi:deoxycytidylate deaminase